MSFRSPLTFEQKEDDSGPEVCGPAEGDCESCNELQTEESVQARGRSAQLTADRLLGGVVSEITTDQDERTAALSVEEALLPHLKAAHNLALWLTRNHSDAEDVVQEAFLRALKFFRSFQGSDGRAWLLTIVRNTCYTWLKRNRDPQTTCELVEATYSIDEAATDPEETLVMSSHRRALLTAIKQLPTEFQEVIVMRELEELSYKQIAEITGNPIGTVMSRLARGRKKLQVLVSMQDRVHSEVPAGYRLVGHERIQMECCVGNN